MHAGHGCEGVDVFAGHPDALSVVATDSVEESVFWGEKSWGHTGVEGESCEGEEISKGHGNESEAAQRDWFRRYL